ncbi:Trm112 family protein [Arthrobacter castelli]|uniref:Trm112 family protein n=1 Tax=Arthrobacter castelli TaxID=271431 RepID=UPI00056536AA|nr:hypothetical protein [Arthrobacter castelli]
MPNLAPDLLSVLRCPVTGSTLTQQDDVLISSANGPQGQPLRYAIDEGIIVLLPSGLQPEPAGSGPDPTTAESTTETGQA